MNPLSKIASAMPFAHFLGLPSATAPTTAAATGGQEAGRERLDGESDDDYAKRMEEKDKRDKEKPAKDGESRRADADGDDADAEADEKDDSEDGKRSGRAQGARQRERIRCAAIVAVGIKHGMVKQACAFAFDTNMSADQAKFALAFSDADRPSASAAPSIHRPTLDERMAHARPANPGDSAPAASAPSLADQILAAGKLRRGEL